MNLSKKVRIKKHRKRKELSKKLLGYSTAAGAALALVASSALAAPIVTTPTSPIVLGLGDVFGIDFNGDTVDDVLLGIMGSASRTIAGVYIPNSNGYVLKTSFSTYAMAMRLSQSTMINESLFDANAYGYLALLAFKSISVSGSASSNTVTNSFTSGQFVGNSGFLGLALNLGSSDLNAAWIDVAVNSDVSQMTISRWAYEDAPGQPIGAGHSAQSVPEPATLGTLAIGVMGLLAWRRRKQTQEKKEEKIA